MWFSNGHLIIPLSVSSTNEVVVSGLCVRSRARARARVCVCVVIIYLLTELMNIVVHNASFLSCDLGVALHNMLHVTHALHRLSRLIPCTDQGIAEERSTRALRSVVLWDCALVKEGEERANGGPGSCDWGCF